MKIKNLIAHLAMLTGLCIACPAMAEPANNQAETQAGVVARLYKDFAWQAVFSVQKTWLPIASQPRPVLEKYFDDELTALLMAEQQCLARRKGELCRIDFDLIFASQDPAAADLTVKQKGRETVSVEFVYPSSNEKIRVEYRLRQTPKGWRISDMRYSNMPGITVKQLLRKK